MDQEKLKVIEWFICCERVDDITEKIELLAAAYVNKIIRNGSRRVLIQRHFPNEHDQNLLFHKLHEQLTAQPKVFKRCRFDGDYIIYTPAGFRKERQRDAKRGVFVKEKEVAA